MHEIYVLGNGAMGYLWASYFNNNLPVNLITRSKVKASFSFSKIPENIEIHTQLITALEIEQKRQTIHRLIICTKAFDAELALSKISHLLSESCEIILIQNGMGSQQAIALAYPGLAIYACSSTEGVYKESESVLVHAGKGENQVGALTKTASREALQSWLPVQVFNWHDDITPVLWRKLIINCAINPLTVLYKCKNGQLLENVDAHNHMARVCAELDNLSQHMGLGLHPTLALAESVCQSTANNYSSMNQDAKHNRTTEINYITGYAVKQFANAAIDCPENKALVKLLAF
jgi:2-dehydropantoate 2-reductase